MNRKINEKTVANRKRVGAENRASVIKPTVVKEVTTRRGAFWVNPKDIVVDFKDKNGNPRLDYGSDWEEFKSSINLYGVQQAIKLYKGDDGKWHLAHGFRRMKAVLELLEDKEANVIERVPFDEVDNNEEQILIEHFTLNNGKPLNDVELGEGLKKLRSLTGIDNVAELARRVSMDYQKAHNLMTFIAKAGTKVKDAVTKGDISFNVGNEIVKKAKNITEQGNLLKEGKENAQKTGKTKIRGKHIAKVNRDKMPFETKLSLALVEASSFEGVDTGMIDIFNQIIESVKNNKDIDEVVQLLTVSMELHHEQ